MTPKKIPLRTCAGCGEKKEKRAMVRVVRTPEGVVTVDPTGKTNGRGVYLCPDPACLAKVRKSKRVERSLEVPVPEAVWSRLEELAHGNG
ncbi:MAG: YlxR family protein [Clostridia bacterium]|nr:YlxR family protein [Clostridia bacterium]